jgi:hypothetical protein
MFFFLIVFHDYQENKCKVLEIILEKFEGNRCKMMVLLYLHMLMNVLNLTTRTNFDDHKGCLN